MMTVPGYKIDEKLYQGSQSVIYRARCRRDDKPVVLKILHKERPTPEEIARFKREFEITSALEAGGVIKALELNRSRDNLLMVLEDFGGESLARWKKLTALQLTLKEFLRLALRVTDILGDIHRQNIIHKDINPSHIVWNRTSGEVKLIDFGISTVLPRETAAHTAPDALAGTLAYMSPEQTGRMNRTIDYRTDFYSLGVTFYELLTSRLPFAAEDPLESVHAHIAKMPAPPHRCRPDIPEPVSHIVVKLMAKNAEDRYQGAHGLKHDLQKCLDQLNAAGKIRRFEIGKTDYPEKFQVPQKLYGREREIETLRRGFERVCGGPTEMMLVTGYSGIGKTSLVRELHKTIVPKQGYFISGKFAQLKRNIPYAPFIQAFRQLLRHVLTGTGKQVTAWKKRILQAVGVNARVIIDVIPDVELVIGKQPPVPDLLPAESQNRFHHVFENFIRVFARQEHPLTIFLDDLQWIDLPSLKLVELFVSDPGTRYLFFIGAYRDNEVDPAHPLMVGIKGLTDRGCRITSITLPPLGPAEVNQLIADALHCGLEAAKPLSGLCLQKTGGNPFFLNQFLQTLYQQHLVEFDRTHGQWRWKIEKIQQAGLTDNVVEFMVGRLKQLPAGTREVLKIAAAIGIRFSLKILSPAMGKTYRETANHLWEALQEQFIFPLDERYSFAAIRDQADFEALAGHAEYQFSHDRIHQAAYSLAAPGQKTGIHAKIGRLMLEHLSPAERHERLFDIVNHLDAGIEVITRSHEMIELAKLNLLAAGKARSSVAYQAGLNAGELEYAGYNLGHMLYSDFFQGKNLEYISKKNENYLDFLQKTKNLIQVHGNIGVKMVIANLRGQTAEKFSFDIGTTTDKQHIERGRQHRTFTSLCDYYIFKSQVLYLYQQHANALESILKAGELLPLSPGSGTKIAQQLDVSSLIKATRFLSAEIVLSHLLKKMMNLIIENAGAQKGLLVLAHENRLFIELECSVEGGIEQLPSIPLEEASTPGQPASLIRFVARTRENLVLNDAGSEGDFITDPYIVKNRPQSVLCVPIIHQGKLTGIIYLENNLTPGAFTADRLEVINILSAQAAVSIENARLYQTLEAKVDERTGQLRGEKERAEMIFDLAGVIMVTLDSQEHVQRINKKGCEVLGYPAAEIIGKNWFDNFLPETDRERTRAAFKRLMAGELEPVKYFENPVLTKTGEKRLVAWHNTLLRDKDGKITGTLSSAEDITLRRRAEEELKAALREKEILLKEIHHRLKNNLQIVSSLLSLQAFKIDDDRLINVLNDSINRINSMAEIHKLLYETESFVRIPFERYLREIASNWHETVANKIPAITIKPKAKNIILDMEKAIPCALIVNELLSNAFKYAFPGKQPGEIIVRLFEKDDHYTLIVSDNGVGFPKDLDIRSASSLGMTIVRNLTAQLRGDMHLERRKGAAITITFPKSSPGGKGGNKNA